jgi:hypothetical protein
MTPLQAMDFPKPLFDIPALYCPGFASFTELR